MPPYGSLGSPSLRKMDHSRGQYGRRNGISIGNIIGDPFALATISISAVSRGRNSSLPPPYLPNSKTAFASFFNFTVANNDKMNSSRGSSPSSPPSSLRFRQAAPFRHTPGGPLSTTFSSLPASTLSSLLIALRLTMSPSSATWPVVSCSPPRPSTASSMPTTAPRRPLQPALFSCPW